MRTPHGNPWVGYFGDDYTSRQPDLLAARKAMFARILSSVRFPIKSVIEFGAGTGENLKALRALLVGANLTGVEVNNSAFLEMKKHADLAFHGSIQEFPSAGEWDLAFTRGLLIHIPEDNFQLANAYKTLYQASRRYILLAEYYNPTQVMVLYRGQDNLLWKRDFAGDMLDRYPDLKLVDYGFVYHRDPLVPQDDITWFLLEKVATYMNCEAGLRWPE